MKVMSSMDDVVGLTAFTLHRNGFELWFDGMVMKDKSMNDDLLVAGAPFMEANDVSVRPSRYVITFSDGSVFTYGSVADDYHSRECESEKVDVQVDQPATTVSDSVSEFQEELDTRPVSCERSSADCTSSGPGCHGDQLGVLTPVFECDLIGSIHEQCSDVQAHDVPDLPLRCNANSCACDVSCNQTQSDPVPEVSDDTCPTLALHAYPQAVYECSLPPTPDDRHPPTCMSDLSTPQHAALPPGVNEPPSPDGVPANPHIPPECTGGAFRSCLSLDTGGIPPDSEDPFAPTLAQDGPSVDGFLVLHGTDGISVVAPVHHGPPGCSVNSSGSSCGAVSGAVPQSNILGVACPHVFPADILDVSYCQEDNGSLIPLGGVSQLPMGGALPTFPGLDDLRAPLQSPPDAAADDPQTLPPICDVSSVPHLLTSADVPPGPPPASSTDVPGLPLATPTNEPGPPPDTSSDVPGPPPDTSTDVPGPPPDSSTDVPGPHQTPLLMCQDPHQTPLLMCQDPHRPPLPLTPDPHWPPLTMCPNPNWPSQLASSLSLL